MSDKPSNPSGLINQPSSSAEDTPDIEDDAKAEREFERALVVLPTTFVDTFHTTYWKGHVKIVFGEESVGEEDYWRIAILMQAPKVKRLIARLQKTLKTLEDREKESS